jgi:CBS domain containing-hemolysin-like protein
VKGGDWVSLAVVVVLFLASIVLALAEMAFARMSRVRAMALAEDGTRAASRLVAMLEHPERTINSLLLLILIGQMTSAYLLGIVLDHVTGGFGAVLGLVVQLVLFFVVAEVIPKTYAIQHNDRAALQCSGFLWTVTNFPPLRWTTRALIGLANVILPGRGLKDGPFVTEEDLRQMADVAAEEAAIELEERELIHSIFEFGDTVVREVMTPRPDLVLVAAAASVGEALRSAVAAGRSRVPVFGDGSDDIVGVVTVKDLVARVNDGHATDPVGASMREPEFVPEQKRVAELLREMQQRKFHLAVVLDEHGDTAGLVTMEDVIEEIVGEIADESDVAVPEIERLADGRLRVPGRTPIDEVSELVGVAFPDDDWDTVAGLVFTLLGHMPTAGEGVTSHGHTFTVERVEGQRIMSVLVAVETGLDP